MSEPATPLNGAHLSGAITIAEAAPHGMITLRCDLADPALARTLAGLGLEVPGQRQIRFAGAQPARGAAWMSPDELLILCDPAEVGLVLEQIADGMVGQPHLAVDVSHARALIALTGAGVREVLAKGMPLDLRPASLPVGQIRRSRLGQQAAAIWFDADDAAHLICFRSVAEHVFTWLATAARPGSLPGYLR